MVRLQADLPIRTVRAIDSLEERLKRGDIPVAREELKHHVGTVTIDADQREVRLYGEGVAAALARAVGSSNTKGVGRGQNFVPMSRCDSDRKRVKRLGRRGASTHY